MPVPIRRREVEYIKFRPRNEPPPYDNVLYYDSETNDLLLVSEGVIRRVQAVKGYFGFDNSGGGVWRRYIHIPFARSIDEQTSYRIVIDSNNVTVYDETKKAEASIAQDFWAYVKPDGSDIRVFDQAKQQLYFWVETFDYSNQYAVIWVNALAGTSEINIAFDNEDAGPSQYHDVSNVALFYEDFSSDPNTNGRWEVYRAKNDPSTEFVYDPANRRVYLTKAVDGRASIAFAKDLVLPDTFWITTYGGAGGGDGADGWAISFFKDIQPYRDKGGCRDGHYLGLAARGPTQSRGYAVEFDSYWNRHIDPSSNHNALVETISSAEPRKHICYHNTRIANEDNKTHKIDVVVGSSRVALYVDGVLHFDCQVVLDRTYRYLAVSAATGGLNNNHWIEKLFAVFKVKDLTDIGSPRILEF